MAKSRRGRGGAESVTGTVDGGSAELRPDRDRPRGWTLLIDGAPQSHVDLDDPAYLDFPYQRRLGHIADLAGPPGKPMRVVHLGGGALTLARYVAATRPRSTQQVVELDTPWSTSYAAGCRWTAAGAYGCAAATPAPVSRRSRTAGRI